MMFVYTKEEDGIKRKIQSHKETLNNNILWLDLYNITPEEEKTVEEFLKINIPTREEMHEIESSSRLYQRDGAVYMTAILVAKADGIEPESHAVTFVLCNNMVITIRYTELKSFKSYASNLVKLNDGDYNPATIYAGILESVIERIADVLENIRRNIDESAKNIFRQSNNISSEEKTDYQQLLKNIGQNGVLISKMRESLVTLGRMLTYALQSKLSCLQDHDTNNLNTLSRDILALSDYASFLSNELNFLLDATLGMVNIEQNNIIKIFSVVSVVFLPPTLIASMYGMNFKLMPELNWSIGYPFAIILMLFSAWLPYKYFKKRKWL